MTRLPLILCLLLASDCSPAHHPAPLPRITLPLRVPLPVLPAPLVNPVTGNRVYIIPPEDPKHLDEGPVVPGFI